MEGLKNRNIVGSLLTRIKGAIPLLNLELQQNIPKNWENLLNVYQDKHNKSSIWLLIDDIDSKYVDNDEYRNRIGSFFSAIRGLSTDVSNLRIRATVRTDVWNSLRHLEDLDKWEQYIFEINWTKRNMQDMLSKRIHSYVLRHHPFSKEALFDYRINFNELFELVFLPQMPWGNEMRPPFDPIKILANNRPRWMGQLCRLAGKQACQSNFKKIGIEQIHQVMETFGKYRKNDLLKEHSHQFEDLDRLIDVFRAGARVYSYPEINHVLLENYAYRKGINNIPQIDGEPYSVPLQLGAFLYKIGFISNDIGDGITFKNYYEDPDLYNSIENKNGNLTWAIHPSYRKYLNII